MLYSFHKGFCEEHRIVYLGTQAFEMSWCERGYYPEITLLSLFHLSLF